MATHAYRNGKLTKISNYDKSLILTLVNIFPNNRILASNFLFKKENSPIGKLRDIYKTKDNSALVRKIFRCFIQEVLTDMVKGNCSFIFPGNIKAEMYVGDLNDGLVRDKRKRGSLNEFDLLATNYKIPYIKYRFSKTSKRQELCVYVSKPLYKELINTANKSKIFSKLPKKIEHFLPCIYEQFPYIKENGIKQIIHYCLRKIAYNLKRGEELRIVDKTGEIKFFRPLGKVHDKVMQKVKKQRITRELNKTNELKSNS